MDLQPDPAAAKLWLDDPKLDRIINAVGKASRVPDRDALRRDLLLCYGRHSILSGPGTARCNKTQIDRLDAIRKHAKTLAVLLKADDADAKMIRGVWPIDPERPAHLLPQMLFLVELIDTMKGMQGKPRGIVERTKMHLGATGSPLQWLIGKLLPEVFTEHFGIEIKSHRDGDRTLIGPYISFCQQVLAEGGIEACSPETIAFALRKHDGLSCKKLQK
jgi:hypothetical protein